MAAKRTGDVAGPVDPLWYKDAVIYELHVRAFCDSDGDGIGDFRGLTEKLGYLQDLGINTIWLLPFYPSPLRDDGYDIADYTDIHPSYGTLRDFKQFLREAHRRGLRVVTELVVNHTSDQHPWFQRARRAPAGSPQRDFYVWSDSPDRYQETRIIFKDFERSNWTWDPVAKAYFWHRFYSHQPDLNFDNPQVHKALFQVVDFWLSMGIDGMRLDAVPYLYEREGTNCENLPETHGFLRALRRYIDDRYQDRLLLAEANQWPEDAVAYFGQGDECHMAFHFPVMPRMFMALRMEDRFPIVDIMEQTPPIPGTAQWALFLRNHDELTLEMVTDEERDYMYRVYANDPQARINLGIRRRLAPLLGNHRRRIELLNGLLCALPGTPVIYYGDEIGMGDNIYLGDRNGVRTPMQWSSDRNAGFSRANPQRLFLPVIIDPEYHFEAVNVEAQQNNPHSLLWWMKRLIALRKRFRAFGHGTLEFLRPENHKVLAFIRRAGDERILVVANLSRFVQHVQLDLSADRGLVPVELFGRTEFPPIGDVPYFLSLGPHSFFWFALEPPRLQLGAVPGVSAPEVRVPELTVTGSWHEVWRGDGKADLERVLPLFLRRRRWFGGKARHIKAARVTEAIPVPTSPLPAVIALVTVEYTGGDPETYVLPLAFASGERAAVVQTVADPAIIARLRVDGRNGAGAEGVLLEAVADAGFNQALFGLIAGGQRLAGLAGTDSTIGTAGTAGTAGEITAATTTAMQRLVRQGYGDAVPTVNQSEQTNTSIVFGQQFVLKLFRRPEAGLNPDLEIGRYLTERAAFAHTPPVAGAIEYRRPRAAPTTLGILQGFVPNQGDAWRFTMDVLDTYFETVLTRQAGGGAAPLPDAPLLDLAQGELPEPVAELIGIYGEAARVLGQRTAELHAALAAETEDPAFAPEPFTPHYLRSLYQSMRSQANQVFQLLAQRQSDLPADLQPGARAALDRHRDLLDTFSAVMGEKIKGSRIRCHGDYHLGQVLYTGKDFVIIDFEGEPARPIAERRIKRSPLRDVAGMLRSFHYAAYAALQRQSAGGSSVPAGWEGRQDAGGWEGSPLEPWANAWSRWVSALFLKSYLTTATPVGFLPDDRRHLRLLLDAYLLDKAVYELGYELNNRPQWMRIPLQGIRQLLDSQP